MNFFIVLLFAGLFISFYALFVHLKMNKIRNYGPLCDISNKISCTKAFKSKKGKILGLPNPVYGIVFYSIVMLLYSANYIFFLKIVLIIAMIFTLYLAHILFFRIKSVCLVCISIYAINMLLLINIFL